MAEPAHRGPQDPWGRKGPRDLQDPQGRQVQLVLRELKVLKEIRALQDLQALPARLALKGRQDPWGHLVRPVLLAPWGQRDLQEPPAQQVLKGQQGQQVHKAQLAVSAL